MKKSHPDFGFLRAAVVTPELKIADVDFNAGVISQTLIELASQGCSLALFPELCLTGYSCADIFYQALLLDRALGALDALVHTASEAGMIAIIGLPIHNGGKLYNCAAIIGDGNILGIVPKTFLPNTNEFYEQRWFTSSIHNTQKSIDINGATVPFGSDLLFKASNAPELIFGVEICEDLWAVVPPSSDMALSGAKLILNPSASNELIGKADYRRDLVRQQSARCLAAYLYASSGPGESSTDVVYSGHSMIAENGMILSETNRFSFSTQAVLADIDLQRLTHERLKNSAFSAAAPQRLFHMVDFKLSNRFEYSVESKLFRPTVSKTPFVPADTKQRARHCQEIFDIQSTALAKRLMHTGAIRITLGISGGLDSTLALLVTVKAFDLLKLNREGIVAITMPGPGTTTRTRSNAEKLAEFLGVSLRHIPIHEAVNLHLRDIGHDNSLHDITFENAQARERTQILMDVANQVGGFTVGTGDLSELALGWCTYNGDHMSMYHVNAGVPKTLVCYLIEWCAESEFKDEVAATLLDICNTPITPELLPVGNQGNLQQKTEDIIGPYILHDFFLFYTVRYMFSPRKILFLACQAFGSEFSKTEIVEWMQVFYKRFFSQQFKRSAMPDGPKVGSVALSPRGDWRMPSDASHALWMQEIEAMKEDL